MYHHEVRKLTRGDSQLVNPNRPRERSLIVLTDS